MSALDFNAAASTRRVDHGSGPLLDNLPSNAGGFSVGGWVVRSANGANQHIWTKDDAIPNRGWLALCDNAIAEGNLRLLVIRGTTNTSFVSSGQELVIGLPVFAWFTFDDAASPKVRIYAGTQRTPAAEVAYNTTTAGSGTINADAAASLYAGNLQRANTNPFLGRICTGIVAAQAITDLGLIRQLQTGVILQPPRTVLRVRYGSNGTGMVWDESGNSNHGTITGATPSNDTLPRLFRAA